MCRRLFRSIVTGTRSRGSTRWTLQWLRVKTSVIFLLKHQPTRFYLFGCENGANRTALGVRNQWCCFHFFIFFFKDMFILESTIFDNETKLYSGWPNDYIGQHKTLSGMASHRFVFVMRHAGSSIFAQPLQTVILPAFRCVCYFLGRKKCLFHVFHYKNGLVTSVLRIQYGWYGWVTDGFVFSGYTTHVLRIYL